MINLGKLIEAVKNWKEKNDAHFKSQGIDREVYKAIPGDDAFICQKRSKLSEAMHRSQGFEYTPKITVRESDGESHALGEVYFKGKFLRRSMEVPGLIPLDEYVKRGTSKKSGGYL